LVKHPLEFLKNEEKIKGISDLAKNPSLFFSLEGLAQFTASDTFE